LADDINKPIVPVGWSLPELTSEEMEKISLHFRSHRAGISKFTPMMCRGPDCEFASECVLMQNGIRPPTDRQCFVEANLVKTWMQGMADELNIKEDDFFDVTSIGAIAINQIIMKRALGVLSREPLIVESFRAMTPEGEPVFEDKANPAIAIIREFTKLNQDIYRDLMVTRREKSKDMARKFITPTEAAQKLRERMKQVEVGLTQGKKSLIEHRQSQRVGEVIDAEFSIGGKTDGDQQGNRREDRGIQGEEGAPVRREESPSVRQEREEPPKERKVRMRRDPKTGFMMAYDGEDTSAEEGSGNNGGS
jgi:hypothetical protein